MRDGVWTFSRHDGKPLFEEVLSKGARVSWVEYIYDKEGVFQESDTFMLDSAGKPMLQGRSASVREGGDILSGTFRNGKGEGSWEEKTPDGKLVVRVNMVSGFAEGDAEVYWPETGKAAARGQLIKTLPQGAWTLGAPGGEKRADLVYEKGLLRSIKVYYPDGKEQLTGDLLDGAPHAKWTTYHPDGSVQTSGTYVRGARQGMWRTADPTGKATSEGLYESGLLMEGQPVAPILWATPELRASLRSLMSDLAYIVAGKGKTESDQRAIAECMLVGDPAEKCHVLDRESARAAHAGDSPQEIERRNRQQDLACAMNNPAACARAADRRLEAARAKPEKDKPGAITEAAGLYQKACDLAHFEAAWKARDATARVMFKDFHSAVACVRLGRLLQSGEVKSKAQAPADLYQRACGMEIEEGCQAVAELKTAPNVPPKAAPRVAPKVAPKKPGK